MKVRPPKMLKSFSRIISRKEKRRKLRHSLLETLEDRRVLTAELEGLYGPTEWTDTRVVDDWADHQEAAADQASPFAAGNFIHRTLRLRSDQATTVSLDYGSRYAPLEHDSLSASVDLYEYQLQSIDLARELSHVLSTEQIETLLVSTSGQEIFTVLPSIDSDGELQFGVSGKPGLAAAETIWLTPTDSVTPIMAIDVFVQNDGDSSAEFQTPDGEDELLGEGEGSSSGMGGGPSGSSSNSSGSSSSSGDSSFCDDNGVCCPPGLGWCFGPDLPDFPEETPSTNPGNPTPEPPPAIVEQLFVRAGGEARSYTIFEGWYEGQSFQSSIPAELGGIIEFVEETPLGPYQYGNGPETTLKVNVLGEVPTTAIDTMATVTFGTTYIAGCTPGANCPGWTQNFLGQFSVVSELTPPNQVVQQTSVTLTQEWASGEMAGQLNWSSLVAGNDFGDLTSQSFDIDFEDSSLDGRLSFVEGSTHGRIDISGERGRRIEDGLYHGNLQFELRSHDHQFYDGSPERSLDGYRDEFLAGRFQSLPFDPLTAGRLHLAPNTFAGNQAHPDIAHGIAGTTMKSVPPDVGETGTRVWAAKLEDYLFGTLPSMFWGSSGTQPLPITPGFSHGFAFDMPIIVEVMTVNEPNFPPVIEPLVKTTTRENQLYEEYVWASDPNGDEVTISAITLPGNMSLGATEFVDGKYRAKLTWNSPQTGSHTITVRATDSLQAFSSDTSTLSVADNPAPYFLTQPPGDPILLSEGQAFAYRAKVQDDEGDYPISWSWAGAPTGMQFLDPTPGPEDTTNDEVLVYWKPDLSDYSTETVVNVTLSASDSLSATQNQTLTITVVPNLKPEILSVPDEEIVVGHEFSYRVITFDEDQHNPVVVTLDESSAPAGMILDEVEDDEGNIEYTIKWTPSTTATNVPFTITATDSAANPASTSQTFELDVVQNLGPEFLTTPPTAIVRVGKSFNYTVETKDHEGDTPISYIVTAPSGLGHTTSNDKLSLSWNPTSSDVLPNGQKHYVSIRALDSLSNERDPQEFRIEVAENLPPEFTSIPPTEVLRGETYRYKPTAKDPNIGDDITFSLVSGPLSYDLATNEFTWQTDASSVDQVAVIRATDDGDVNSRLSVEQTFSITIREVNEPPIFLSTPVVDAYVGEEYSYVVNVADPNGDEVFLTMDRPVFAEYERVDGEPGQWLVTWTPDESLRNTSVEFELWAGDGQGAFTPQEFQVYVHADPDNNPPVITSVPKIRIEQAGDGLSAVGSVQVEEPLNQQGADRLWLNLEANQPPTDATVSFSLDAAPPAVDVLLLLDDTTSFEIPNRFLQSEFADIVTDLTAANPNSDFGFGIARYEDFKVYTNGTDNDEADEGRAFILNQPILSTDYPRFNEVIQSALTREARGYGGNDLQEALIEAIYQATTGAGYDGNNANESADSGSPGSLAAQIAPGDSFDVPQTQVDEDGNQIFEFEAANTAAFRLVQVADQPRLRTGQTTTGTLSTDLKATVYQYIGQAGNTLKLDGNFWEIDDDEHRIVSLYAPDGSLVPHEPQPIGSIHEFVLPVTGRYALVIDHDPVFSTRSHEYSVNPPAVNYNEADDTPMTLPWDFSFVATTVAGALPPSNPSTQIELDAVNVLPTVADGEQLDFNFDLDQPTTPILRMLGNAAATWSLYSGDGNLILWGDETDEVLAGTQWSVKEIGQIGNADRMSQPGDGVLPAGQYRLSLTFTGAHTDFAFRVMDPNLTSHPLELDATVSTEFTAEHQTQFTTFRADGGQLVDPALTVTSTDEVTFLLRLLSPSGEILVAQAEEYSELDLSSIVLPMDGRYTLEVSIVDSINPIVSENVSLTLSDAGKLSRPQYSEHQIYANEVNRLTTTDLDTHRVFIESMAGQQLYFDGFDSDARIRVDYYDADGTALFSLANSELNRMLPTAPFGSTHFAQFEPIDLIADVDENRLGGSGFRPGALPVIIATGDHGTRYRPDLDSVGCTITDVNGVGSTTVDLELIVGQSFRDIEDASCAFAPDSQYDKIFGDPNVPGGNTASVQDAVTGLVDLGAFLVGLGLDGIEDSNGDLQSPGSTLANLAKLTGAINSSGATLTNDPNRSDDDIADGDPLYLPLPDYDASAGEWYELSNSIVNAVSNVLSSVAYDVDVRIVGDAAGVASTTTSNFNITPGSSQNVDFTLQGDGGSHSFFVEFVREGTDVLLARMPIGINYSYGYDVDARDADGDVLSYSLVGEDHGATINAATGEISWLPPAETFPNPQTEFEFTVQVVDGRGGSDTQSWIVTVDYSGSQNTAPTIESIEDQIAIKDRPFELNVVASDDDFDALQFQLVAEAGVSEIPDGMVIHPTKGIIRWTPQASDVGQEYTIQVRVNDGRAEASETFKIKAESDAAYRNRRPYFTSEPNSLAIVGTQYTYDFTAVDPDNDLLTFSLADAPDGMVVDSLARRVAWSPSEADVGEHSVLLLVSDGAGGTDTQRFTLRVSTPNLPPVFTSDPSAHLQYGLDNPNPWTYLATTSDPNGDDVKLSLTKRPIGMRLAPNGVLEWQPTKTGYYDVELQAEDGRGGVATQSFTVQVVTLAIPAPTINNFPTGPAIIGDKWTYTIDATPYQSQAIQFELLSAPAGMTIDDHPTDSNKAIVEWVPAALPGNYMVEIWVSYVADSTIGANRRFELPVTFGNFPPIIKSVPYDARVGNPWTYQLDVDDPNGDELEYELIVSQPGMTLDENGLISWTPNYVDYNLGKYNPFKVHGRSVDPIVTVVAGDGFGGEVTDEVFAVVEPPTFDHLPPNSPLRNVPYVRNNPTGPIYFDKVWTHQLDVVDPNGDEAALQYEFVELNDGSQQIATQHVTVDSTGLVTANIPSTLALDPDDPKYNLVFKITDAENWERIYEMQMRFRDEVVWSEFTNEPDVPPVPTNLWSHTPTTDYSGATLGISADSHGTWDGTSVSFTPSEPGTFPLVVTATDGSQLADGTTIVFRQATTLVTASSSLITSMPEVSIVLEDDAKFEYQVTTTSPSNVYRLISSPAGMEVDENGLVTWEPAEAGNYDVVLEVVGTSGTATQEFILSVIYPYQLKQPPEFTSTPIEIAERDVEYSYEVNAIDPNGDTVTYTVQEPSWLSYQIVNGVGVVTGTPTAGRQERVVIVASDGELETTQQYTLTTLQNARPHFDSIPSNAVYDIGSTNPYTFPVVATDPNPEDQDGLKYTAFWRGNGDARFNDLIVDQFEFETTDTMMHGRHDILLRVTDQAGGSDEEVFSIQVLDPNRARSAPEFTSLVRTSLVADWEYSLQLTATDADGDDIEFSFDGTPPTGAAIDQSTGILTWTPAASLIGTTQELRIKALSLGESPALPATVQVSSVDITALPDNEAPVIDTEGDHAPIAAATANYIYENQFVATDGDNDALYWNLEKGPADAFLGENSGLLTWVPLKTDAGVHDVEISVSDGYGGIDTLQYQLIVRSKNVQPIFTTGMPRFAELNQLFETTLEAEDAERNPLLFMFEDGGWEGARSTLDWGVSGQSNDDIKIDVLTGEVEWQTFGNHGDQQSGVVTVWDRRGPETRLPFTITTYDPLINAPPAITNELPQYFVLGESKTHQVNATDDNLPSPANLVYSLRPELAGLSINESTGLITWDDTNTEAEPGATNVTVEVFDGEFRQMRTTRIEIVDNAAPVLSELNDIAGIYGGETVRLRAVANDPDGNKITYTATVDSVALTGDEMDPVTGDLLWVTPAVAQGAPDVTYTVEITATDPYGSSDTESFTVTTTHDNVLPTLRIDFHPKQLEANTDLLVTVVATDNVAIDWNSLTLSLDAPIGPSYSFSAGDIDSNGRITIAASEYVGLQSAPGSVVFSAGVDDVSANNVTKNETLQIVNQPPKVVIKSPKYNEEVYGLISVHGTIDDTDDLLDSYTVSVFNNEHPDQTIVVKQVASGAKEVIDGSIALFDPTLLENGLYTLVVSATDQAGYTNEQSVPISIEGNYKPGVLTLGFTDLEIPTADIPLTISRSYSSANADVLGDFGNGWSLELGIPEIEVAYKPEAYQTSSGRPMLIRGTRVTVTLPDGSREGFTFEPIPERTNPIGLVLSWLPYFHPDKGNTAYLGVKRHPLWAQNKGEFEEFVDFSTRESYHPEASTFGGYWKVITQGGPEIYVDGSRADMGWLEDRNGNKTSISPDGITHWSGKSIQILRDSNKRITEIKDPNGNSIHYTYETGSNRLVTVTDRLGEDTTYAYTDTSTNHANYLTSITDPVGREQLAAEYHPDSSTNINERNRLSRITDVQGWSEWENSFEYNVAARNQDVTVDGATLTVIVDRRGNPVYSSDPVGVSSRSKYDQEGNLIEQRQIVGNIDGKKGIQDDLVSTYEYNQFGQPEIVTDANGLSTTYDYTNDHQVETVVAPGGPATHYAYDRDGNLITATNPLGDKTKLSYGYRGLLNTVKNDDDLRLVDQEHDFKGNLISTTDADGNVTKFEYNTNGHQSARVSEKTDNNGSVTLQIREETDYDVMDRVSERRLIHMIPVAGIMVPQTISKSETVYDGKTGLVNFKKETRYLPSGEESLATYYQYDQRGNQLEVRREVRVSDGATESTTWSTQRTVYDKNGRVVWSTDSYESDASGDPLAPTEIGAVETFYDAAGRTIGTKRWVGVSVTISGTDAYDRSSTADTQSGTIVSSTETIYDSAGRVHRSRGANGLWTENFYGFNGEVVQTRNETLDENREIVHMISRTLLDDLGRPLFSEDAYLEEHTHTLNVLNYSFEEPDIQVDGSSVTNAPEWTIDNPGAGTAGIINASGLEYSGVQSTDGKQVAFADGNTLTQSLGRDLQANRSYTLQVDVGHPNLTTNTGYKVGLYAGGILLAELTEQDVATVENGFVSTTLTHISPPEIQPGQELEIRLTSNGGVVHFDNARLIEARLGVAEGQGSKNYYDSQGRTVRVEQREAMQLTLLDRYGAEVFDYDSAEGPFSVRVDDQGTVVSATQSIYNADGQLERSISSTGADTRYEYDERGRQIRQISAAVDTVESKDPLRHITETEYDDQGRAYRTWSNIRGRDLGDKILIDRRFAVSTTQIYDDQGRVVSTVHPDGTTSAVTYDDFGNVITEYDADGFAKAFEYDLQGRLTAVELPQVEDPQDSNTPKSPRFEYAYDWSGNQTRLKDSLGRETAFTFDAAGRQTSRTLPEGIDAFDQLSAGTDPRTLAGDPAAFTEAFYYNERGQQIRHVSFEGVVTVSVYDNGTSNLFSTTNGAAATELDTGHVDYKLGSGRMIEQHYFEDLTAYNGGAGTPNEIRYHSYDALGRKSAYRSAKVIDSNGTEESLRVEHWLYDEQGRVVQAFSPEGVVNYAYDPITGQQTRIWTTESAGLDPANLAEAIEDTHYSYNNLGWLTGVTVVEKDDTPLTAAEQEETVYGHDLQGRQLRVDMPNSAIESREIDVLGQITRIRHYGPDATPHDLGDNPLRAQFDYTINPQTRQRERLEETLYFDDDNDSETPDVAKTTTYDWVYDGNDRLVSETINHHEDALDRTESFVMDLFGNRRERLVDYVDTNAVDQAFAYSYDDNDRLLTETLDNGNDSSIDQTTTYTWDDTQQTGKAVVAGAQAVSTQLFDYDLQGRLAEVVTESHDSSGVLQSRVRVQYAYDSSGIRIRTSDYNDANLDGTFETAEEGNTTEYLIDHRTHTGYAQTIVETTTDSNGQSVKRIVYTFGTDEITQTVTTYDASGNVDISEVHHFGHDAHGSVRVLIDAAGAISQAYTYAAYGELLAIHNTSGALLGGAAAPGLEAQAFTNVLYSGELVDSRIGQQYLRARWYNAAQGQFSRLDPYFGTHRDPLSFNKYAYVHANPIKGTDPTGRDFNAVSRAVVNGIQLGQRALNSAATLASYQYLRFSVLIGNVLWQARQLAVRAVNWAGANLARFFDALVRLPNAVRDRIANLFSRTPRVPSEAEAIQSAALNRNGDATHPAITRWWQDVLGLWSRDLRTHHLVEQSNKMRFDWRAIHSTANTVPISERDFHKIISTTMSQGPGTNPFMSAPNWSRFSHLRDYVNYLPWEQQWRWGQALYQHVLRYGTTTNFDPAVYGLPVPGI